MNGQIDSLDARLVYTVHCTTFSYSLVNVHKIRELFFKDQC